MTDKNEKPNRPDETSAKPEKLDATMPDLSHIIDDVLQMSQQPPEMDTIDDETDVDPDTQPVEEEDTTYDLTDHAKEAMRMERESHERVLEDAELRASSAMQGDPSLAIHTVNHRLQLALADSTSVITLQAVPEMIIGRGDKLTEFSPEIDLTELGAYRLGISRRHARLTYKNERLYLRDLDSRNGTSVNGLRLEGSEMRVIRHGDTIQLGNLRLQVRFIEV